MTDNYSMSEMATIRKRGMIPVKHSCFLDGYLEYQDMRFNQISKTDKIIDICFYIGEERSEQQISYEMFAKYAQDYPMVRDCNLLEEEFIKQYCDAIAAKETSGWKQLRINFQKPVGGRVA